MRSIAGTVLVYGGNGAQGQAITGLLAAQGWSVRAAVRTLRSAAPAHPLIAPVQADLGDAESLMRLSDGCTAIALSLPLVYDRAVMLRYADNVLAAAAAAGVRHIVYNSSGPIAAAGTGVTSFEVKAAVAQRIAASEVPVTRLVPRAFAENIVEHCAQGLARGVFSYPLEAGRPVAWLSRDDLAAFVAAALGRPESAGGSFDLGGPDMPNGEQAAAMIGAVIGRPIAYEQTPLAEFAADLDATLGAPVGDNVAGYYGYCQRQPADFLAPDTRAARAALDVAPLGFTAWAERQCWPARQTS